MAAALESKSDMATNEMKSDLATDEVEKPKSFEDRVKALPIELFESIYDLTFTAAAKVRVFVDDQTYGLGPFEDDPKYGPTAPAHQHISRNRHAPTNLMQVGRKSRLKFARSFYGERSVVVACGVDGLSKLIGGMSARHVPFLRLYVRDAFGFETDEIRRRDLQVCYGAGIPEQCRYTGLEQTVRLEFGGQ